MINLHWFVPTAGDSRYYVGHFDKKLERKPDMEYLKQVVLAAESVGFEGVLLPTGLYCEDPWITASVLSQYTKNIRFLVAIRPDATAPMLVAHMAGTAQRMFGGRLDLQIVAGGKPEEQIKFGDYKSHDQRYERMSEFIGILKEIWAGESKELNGKYYKLQVAPTLLPTPNPLPKIYIGGSSENAIEVSAKQADVHLFFGEPPEMIKDNVYRIKRMAGNRAYKVGMRLNVVTRDSSEEAWSVADRYMSSINEGEIKLAQTRQTLSESISQKRMRSLHQGRFDKLEVSPNLWAGMGLVRGGSGTALVGSHIEVANRIIEYSQLGINEFIFSGYPHLEEALHFGEGVMPILRKMELVL
ncbi:LLM class flavin-dependent oxidoreductase [Cohnella sp. GCM10020058]|uniref:LLM class flavin-dependent oxidoreductase n=1 Tax=Cohnella sp. GCM10020058 TaxID=3317330 RepID=UPI0036363979